MLQSNTTPIDILLGIDTANFADKGGEGINQFSFLGWRKEGEEGAGRYIKKYIDGDHADEWNFVQTGTNAADKPRH